MAQRQFVVPHAMMSPIDQLRDSSSCKLKKINARESCEAASSSLEDDDEKFIKPFTLRMLLAFLMWETARRQREAHTMGNFYEGSQSGGLPQVNSLIFPYRRLAS